jgi:hypothetical protein
MWFLKDLSYFKMHLSIWWEDTNKIKLRTRSENSSGVRLTFVFLQFLTIEVITHSAYLYYVWIKQPQNIDILHTFNKGCFKKTKKIYYSFIYSNWVIFCVICFTYQEGSSVMEVHHINTNTWKDKEKESF